MNAPESQRSKAASRDRNSVAAVEKSISLLVELARVGRPLKPAQLADLAGMSQTGVYRLLRALEKGRAVERLASGEYVLGFLAHELATSFDAYWRIKIAAAGPMLGLRDRSSGETVGLYVRVNLAEFQCIETLPGRWPLRHDEKLYRPIPVSLGTTSQVMLADTSSHHGAAFVERYVRGLPADVRPESVHQLLDLVEQTRRNDFAVGHGARFSGLSAIAAPVRGEFGQLIAVLTLSGATVRFNERAVAAWAPMVRAAAAQIGEGLRAAPSSRPDDGG
jgi:IclR family KDG regulon transcriptional repressor